MGLDRSGLGVWGLGRFTEDDDDDDADDVVDSVRHLTWILAAPTLTNNKRRRAHEKFRSGSKICRVSGADLRAGAEDHKTKGPSSRELQVGYGRLKRRILSSHPAWNQKAQDAPAGAIGIRFHGD